jgi:diguanylate cyclase (GGDEF)-like protein/PAS domain S-box-containing protein
LSIEVGRTAEHALDALVGARGLIEATPECLVVAAADGQILYANHRLEELSGFARDELLDRPVEELLVTPIPLTAELVGAPIDASCRHRDGTEIPVQVHVGAVEGGPVRYLVLTVRDASELRHGEAARFEAEAKYSALVEGIPAITYLDPIDEDEASIYVSPQVSELLGIAPEEWLADPFSWRRHVHPEDEERAWNEYVAAYRMGGPLNHEYRMVHEDGHVLWVSEQALVIRNEAGEPWLIQGVIFDITERKRAEEQISFLAYHDKLTGLPNRLLFEEMLDLALARARRHGLGVGVLFLDLDNFKLVNDSLGHHAGDALLAQLGERLRECTRETDLVARQGGDEFLILISDIERTGVEVPSATPAIAVAESVALRVQESLQEPFDLGGTQFYATASIGISLFPDDASDGHSLLRNADAAMYQSKKAAPGGWVVYREGRDDPLSRLSLTTRLRRAVDEKHWLLYYQPIVGLEDRAVQGVEALIRWREPGGGIVPPGEFIPLAEELGLIEAIGDWVVEELARQDLAWREQGLELQLSFNLSPRQLWASNLAEKILARFGLVELSPSRVTIEVTESTAMTDPERTQRVLSELHAWGFRIGIDDFGTGYSSLSRLNHLPADVLKIDRSFIRDVDRNPNLGSMMRAIQPAGNLGKIALAEGIETEEELAFLRDAGCPLGQGFLFHRPVPGDQILKIVRP